MRSSLTPLALWAVHLLVLFCLPGLAHAQSGSMGVSFFNSETTFKPELSTRDVKVISRVLRLSDDERQSVESLHSGYAAALATRAEEIKAYIGEIMEEAEVLEDQRLLLPAQSKVGEWQAEAEVIKKGFLDDLRGLLTQEQESRWNIVERELRRLKKVGLGKIDGESVDVIALVQEVAPEAAEEPEIAEVLERYAQDLDRLLVSREAACEAAEPEFYKAVKEDVAQAERIWKAARAARVAIRSLNERYVREVSALMVSEQAESLKNAFFEAANTRVVEPTRGEHYVREAAKLESLTPEQEEEMKAILAEYERERRRMLEQIAAAHAEVSEAEKPWVLRRALGEVEGEPPGFTGKSPFEADHPVAELKRERLMLDRRTRDKVNNVLNASQKASIVELRPEWVQFQQWETGVF